MALGSFLETQLSKGRVKQVEKLKPMQVLLDGISLEGTAFSKWVSWINNVLPRGERFKKAAVPFEELPSIVREAFSKINVAPHTWVFWPDPKSEAGIALLIAIAEDKIPEDVDFVSSMDEKTLLKISSLTGKLAEVRRILKEINGESQKKKVKKEEIDVTPPWEGKKEVVYGDILKWYRRTHLSAPNKYTRARFIDQLKRKKIRILYLYDFSPEERKELAKKASKDFMKYGKISMKKLAQWLYSTGRTKEEVAKAVVYLLDEGFEFTDVVSSIATGAMKILERQGKFTFPMRKKLGIEEEMW